MQQKILKFFSQIRCTVVDTSELYEKKSAHLFVDKVLNFAYFLMTNVHEYYQNHLRGQVIYVNSSLMMKNFYLRKRSAK